MKGKCGFVDIIKIKEKYVFFDIYANRIMSIQEEDGKVYLEQIVDTKILGGRMLYGSIKQYDNKLIFVPYRDIVIMVWDLDLGKLCYFPLKNTIEGMKKPLFLSAYLRDSKLILLPYQYDSIVEFDLKTNEIGYKSLVRDNANRGKIAMTSVINNNHIYFIKCGTDLLCEYDVDSKQTNEYKINGIKSNIVSMTLCGNILFCTQLDDRVFCIDIMSKEGIWIAAYDNVKKPQYGLGQIVSLNELILVMAINEEIIYQVDYEQGKIREWLSLDSVEIDFEELKLFAGSDITSMKIIDNNLYLYSIARNKMYKIDVESKKVEALALDSISIDTEKVQEIKMQRGVLYENALDLATFIERI